jgi:glutamine amidotransferase
MTTIIDYGIGNLRSIEKAFEAVGADVVRTDDADTILSADRVVLPGVGAFGACMTEVAARELTPVVREVVSKGTPFLGVCVGMQMLFSEGHERGTYEGLGILPGTVVHFNDAANATDAMPTRKVPHMGWNTLNVHRDSPLLADIAPGDYVYFVHSYHAQAEHEDDVLASASYDHAFPAIVQRDNVFGVQFHPEKSHAVGLQLLKNFAALS